VRIKQALEQKHVFSYPLLWACYHYGLDYVAAHGYDVNRIPIPSDPVAYKLWSGEIHPLAPPQMPVAQGPGDAPAGTR
jgi:hypothetical protein